MLVSEAIDRYIVWRSLSCSTATRKTYAQSLRLFALYVRDKPLSEVSESDIVEWLMGMEALGWERNSLIPKASALRGMFVFWKKKGIGCIDPDLIPMPKKECAHPRVASDESIRALLSGLTRVSDDRSVRNRAIISILRATGIRVGELCAIDSDDMRFDERSIVIHTEKSRGKYPLRRVFWTKEEDGHIFAWRDRRMTYAGACEAFFVSAVGAKKGQRLTIKGVDEMFRRLSARVGIDTVNPHSFRHRFGRVLAENGANNSAISSLLGHASLNSSFQYTRLWGESAKKVYDDIFGFPKS